MNAQTLIFVYGTLKRGGSLHYLLRDAEFLGTGRTFDRHPMVINIIPYLIDVNAGHHIEGELFSVRAGELAAIDSLEGNPNWCRRKLRTVMVAGDPYRAFIYFLQPMAYRSVPNWQHMTYHSVFPVQGVNF